MKLVVKVWPDNSAAILTENGNLIWRFPSVYLAYQAYERWNKIQQENLELYPEFETDTAM